MPSAAIPNGGRAGRFDGRDKGALLVGGHTIRARQLAQLATLSDALMVAGGRPDLGPPGVRFVADRRPGLGPLAGLDAALEPARDEVVVVIACDMPFVTAPFLEYLLALIPGVDAVVPRARYGYHSLCAVYTRACRSSVTRRLAAGHLAVTRLLDELQVRVVSGRDLDRFGPGDQLLANVNTPAAYDELEAPLGHEL